VAGSDVTIDLGIVFTGDGVDWPGSWKMGWSSRILGGRELRLPFRPFAENILPILPPPPTLAELAATPAFVVVLFLVGLNASLSLPTGDGLRRWLEGGAARDSDLVRAGMLSVFEEAEGERLDCSIVAAGISGDDSVRKPA
jgi:preprotein translocase subunit Sec61beta